LNAGFGEPFRETYRCVLGEFNWSSQRLECGGVRWAGLRDG
jgi:hypothetical protein